MHRGSRGGGSGLGRRVPAGLLRTASWRGRVQGRNKWGPRLATELTVEVLPPPVINLVRVADVMRWLEGVAADRRRFSRRPG